MRLPTRLLLSLNRLLTHSLHQVRLTGPCTVPPTGPAIVAPNHTSGLDPLLVQTATPRHIRWMMAAEYTKIPGMNWFWSAIEIIPVRRDGRDATATRAALRVLAAGGVIGIFPEGRISPRRRMLPLHPGIAHLAHRSGAPTCPVWIAGTQRKQEMIPALLTPQEATVSFAAPILPDRQLAAPQAVALLLTDLDRAYHRLSFQHPKWPVPPVQGRKT